MLTTIDACEAGRGRQVEPQIACSTDALIPLSGVAKDEGLAAACWAGTRPEAAAGEGAVSEALTTATRIDVAGADGAEPMRHERERMRDKLAEMAHLKKQSRIDLAVVRDAFVPSTRTLLRKATADMLADPLTKAMKDVSSFHKHRRNMGIVDCKDYDKFVVEPAEVPQPSSGSSMAGQVGNALLQTAKAAVTAIAEDPDNRTRVARWVMRKTMGI